MRHRAKRRTLPYLVAASERVEVLRSALGIDSDPGAERKTFAENYGLVSNATFEAGHLLSSRPAMLGS